MRLAVPAAKSPRVRTSMLFVVLAGLCFSMGEGLRLLPLPLAPPGPGAGTNSSPGVSSLEAAGRQRLKPGSLGLPPQAQKNDRHRQTHCAPPPGRVALLPHRVSLRHGEEWRAGGELSASAPGPSGRAPPRAA